MTAVKKRDLNILAIVTDAKCDGEDIVVTISSSSGQTAWINAS